MSDTPPADTPPADAEPRRYELAFLTDQWEWEADVVAETPEQAKAAAYEALEALVRDEAPELACVTLLEDGVKIGVWDWVERQPFWTPL
ncbi:MAG: hypothetical protein KGO51_00205 [Alphaproteobacteria bacterium]|nr:hypothetical protein [Alphaproteobacteria bacterium]